MRYVLVLMMVLGCACGTKKPSESRAENAAKDYFLNLSKTPATVKFQTIEVFDKEGSVFLVHAVFDEQNEAGALLRKSYCVTIIDVAKKKDNLSPAEQDFLSYEPRECPRQLQDSDKTSYKDFVVRLGLLKFEDENAELRYKFALELSKSFEKSGFDMHIEAKGKTLIIYCPPCGPSYWRSQEVASKKTSEDNLKSVGFTTIKVLNGKTPEIIDLTDKKEKP